MSHSFFAIPGDLSAATGGYAYDRQVMAECAGRDFTLAHCPLPAGYPDPSDKERQQTAQILAALPRGLPLLIDGLALGAFDSATIEAIHSPLVALVHHPLAYETGLPEWRRAILLESERSALASAQRVIAVSRATADLLAQQYGVPDSKITIAEPGVARAQRACGSSDHRLSLLAVGAISPRKAYPLLVEALASLPLQNWRLTIVGPVLDDSEAQKIEAIIQRHDLGAHIRLAGRINADALASCYDEADLFVIASLFEGYGMVVTEALARGLPIVSTTGGALDSTVPDDASLKVPPGDVTAFAGALHRLMADRQLRTAKAEAAWQRARDLPSWANCATMIVNVLKGVAR